MTGRATGVGPVRTSLAEPQAAYDVMVVGAGLAGLFAGWLAASRGARVLVLARGQGNLALGAGAISVWARTAAGEPAPNPLAELIWLTASPTAAHPHPLLLAGLPALRSAIEKLQSLCAAAGYPLVGDLDRNHFLPTALGALRPVCLAPATFVAGDVRQADEVVLADLPGFRDFQSTYAAANLCAAGWSARSISLPLPRAPARRDLYATDLARLIDTPAYRALLADAWRPALDGVSRLGMPAILGLAASTLAWSELGERLGVSLFEIPILPPSVPGLRLQNILLSAIESAGGRVTIGPAVRGWLPAASSSGAPVLGVVADTAGGPRHYSAAAVVLASGGFRHGGLLAPSAGRAVETIFDLPVRTGADWFEPAHWRSHPYTRFGVAVNEAMQPVDGAGQPLYSNLWAIGGLVAEADRIGEGCREAVDLATAWRAVSALSLPGLTPLQ